MRSHIHLKNLLLSIPIGWSEEERKQKQVISVDITIHFAKLPSACFTDQLNDTVCYETLLQQMTKIISAKSYRLLESLGHEIYQIVKSLSHENASVSIRVTKKPTITNLEGGASFFCGDEE